MIVRTRRQHRFGVLFGCAPFQLALDRLGTTLAQADTVGVVKTAPARVAAQNFYDKYNATLAFYYIYDDKACQTITMECEGHLNAVGKLIDAIKGAGTSSPSTGPIPDQGKDRPELSKRPGDQGSPLGDLKWVGIGAAALAVAYMFGPAIRAIISRRKG